MGYAPATPVATGAAQSPGLMLEAPSASAPAPAQLRAAAEPLDLALDQISLEPPAPTGHDELVLDAAAPVTPIAAARRAPADPDPAPAPTQQGTTLFERMASLSRGRSASGAEANGEAPAAEATGSISFPRFLSRQNNQ
jgi:cell division protein FtsZ